MKSISDKQLIRQLMAENAELKSQSGSTASAVDYLAMMSDIEIPVDEEGTDNAQSEV